MAASSEFSRLEGFWDQHVFSVGNANYQWIDITLAAMVRGEWSAFERRLAEGLACAAYARFEGSYPSADELDEAATAFRYDRDLISAAEMNGWLADTGVSVEDWTAYLARNLLRRRWTAALDEILDGHPASAPQLVAAAFAEGRCSGDFDALDAAFAARAALAADGGATTTEPGPAGADVEITRLARTHAHWLSLRPADDIRARLRHVLQIESLFQATTADLVARSSLAEIVDQHRSDWQQVELDTVAFTSEHAAREAVLCVTIDRLSLHDVAALSRSVAERRTVFHDQIDVERRDRLLTIEPGGVIGPFAVNGHFEVTSLVRRTRASLEDPRVVDRAQRTVIEAAIDRAARDGVTRRRHE